MSARSTANIDDTPRLAILDSKVRRSCPYQPEGRSIMYSKDSLPLLIRDLVNDPIPSIARVIDDIVDLPASELSCFFDQDVEVSFVRDISGDSDGAVGRGVVDGFGDGVGFGRINVADYDFGAFVREEAGCFGADALS